ncbi:MAG TPA: ABC transporter permease [Acidimicrobiales bacterium]|nr:ABC transporter permease [Acidimicrobiales bacterium]
MSDQPAVAEPVAERAPEWALPVRLVAALPMLRVAEREARVWARYWRTTFLSGTLMPLMFLGAMGVGLGGLVDENRGTVDGVDYLAFVTPGILAATALQGAAGNSLWPVMGGMKWMRTFHAAAASPVSPGQVYAGYVGWGVVRMVINASLFVAIAAVLGGVTSAWGVLAVPAAALGGLAFAAPLTAYSAGADSDVTFPIVMRVAVMPMFLFSGTFFPVDQLPDWLEPLAWVSPLWHAVELCRGATTGSISLGAALGHLLFLAVVTALGARWGVRTFRSKLAA